MKSQLVGTIQRPGQRPENIELVVDKRPNLTRAERAAGIEWVNGDYDPGDLLRYGPNTTPGTTDMSGAVGSWLDVGMQGQELIHPGGNVKITSWTQKEITADIKIRGKGDAKFTGTTSLDFLKPAGGSIDIDGVEFDAWRNVIQNVAADSGSTPSLSVTNCTFNGVSLYCIRHERPITKAVIRDNSFTSLTTGAILIGTDTYANQDDWKDILITGNSCVGITNAAAGNVHFALVFGRFVRATDNHIENLQANTGECWGLYIKTRYGAIANNTVYDVDSTSSTTAGIQVKGKERGDTGTTQGWAVAITGNSLYGAGGTLGIGVFTDDILVTGNHIENFASGILGTADADNTTITGNRIIGVANTSGNYGVNWNADGDNVVISNNSIEKTFNAIRVAPSTARNFVISDNAIVDCGGPAINLDPVTSLTNCVVNGNTVDTATALIFYDYCIDLHITNNNYSNLSNSVTNQIDSEASTSFPVYVSGNQPLEVETTNASTTDIFWFYVPDDKATVIEATVIAMEDSNSDRALYQVKGLFYGSSGSAVQEGSTAEVITPIESDANWAVTMGVSGSIARIRVLGAASTTIRWRADVKVMGLQ